MDFSTKKERINYYDAIKLISLDNTLKLNNNQNVSREYDLNRIFRGYSRKFYTPLHVVYTLPLQDVLTAYFDDLFENMDPDQLEDMRIELIKSEEDKAKEKAAEEDHEAEDLQILEQMSREAEESAKKIEALTKSGVRPLVNNRMEAPMGNPLLEDLKKMPEIKMSFVSPAELEEQMDKDSLGLLD